MKTIFTFLAVAVFYFGSSQETKFVNNHLIVKIKEIKYKQSEVDLSQNKLGVQKLDALNIQSGISSIKAIGQHQNTRTFLLVFQNPIDMPAFVKKYNQTGLLEYAEPNYIASGGGEKFTLSNSEIIPNDNRFNRQWGLYNPGTQTGIGTVIADSDVDMELAWDIQTGDPNMIIAISDSGLRLTHPDIASRVWSNPLETANGIDDDGNGLIDDIKGWDWINNDNDPTDDLGHGTNIAGIIGAIANNNSLFAGANWNSKLMILKSLDQNNSATYEGMASSIYYAADNGAKVLSMSLGGGPSNLIRDAVAYTNTHNMIFVACMMNFNTDVPFYPAAYSTEFSNMIAVGSTNPNDFRTAPFFWSASSGSSYGAHLNVVAPGNYIYSLASDSDTNSGEYWGGTSQATPLVAAIASLIAAENPELTPLQVRTVLENTAQDQVGKPSEDTPGFDQYMGHGRVNAHAALQSVLATHSFDGALTQEFQIINPANQGLLQIMSKGQYPGNYSLSVNNIDGKILQSSEVNMSIGLNKIPFNYPPGNYIVTLKSEQYTKIFKVLAN